MFKVYQVHKPRRIPWFFLSCISFFVGSFSGFLGPFRFPHSCIFGLMIVPKTCAHSLRLTIHCPTSSRTNQSQPLISFFFVRFYRLFEWWSRRINHRSNSSLFSLLHHHDDSWWWSEQDEEDADETQQHVKEGLCHGWRWCLIMEKNSDDWTALLMLFFHVPSTPENVMTEIFFLTSSLSLTLNSTNRELIRG